MSARRGSGLRIANRRCDTDSMEASIHHLESDRLTREEHLDALRRDGIELTACPACGVPVEIPADLYAGARWVCDCDGCGARIVFEVAGAA